jgi:membrane-associated phospholipid phosphatase
MTKDDFLMRMKLMVLVLGCAALSLTLTAPSSMAAPPQAQRQRAAADAKDEDARSSSKSSDATREVKTEKPKDAADLQGVYAAAGFGRGFHGLAKDFLRDQEQIWTSPVRLRFSDTEWFVPFSGITAGLFVTDRDFSKHLSQNPSTISHYKTLSNAGVGALIGGAGGMWLLGHVSHNEHWSETGFLAGEAALNSLVAVETLKYSLGRQRPFQGDESGPFFHSGGTSFPSEHSAAAWSVAGVLAHEYPGPLMKIAAYGLASLVDYSRIRSRQHFPSDVLVGSIMGNLIAQNVYSRHHDPELGGREWRSISQIFRGDGTYSPANQGSPYVPLDSWIYPALDRLAAMGLIDSGFAGMKPWTRNECFRLLQEASEMVVGGGRGGPEAEKIYRVLETEFRDEIEGRGGDGRFRGRIESVYARVTGISGQPITDGNHFGQTVINDFGRPYQEGFNSVDGFSAWTTAGRWVGYVRAEYQHAPSAPAQPSSARQFIASVDSTPGIPPATPISSVDRVRLLDAYVGMNFENWEVSFGKQSLWWSPMQGGPLMFSENAEPVNMFRINCVSPFKLPWILGWLGPMRVEWFFGQFTGHEFVNDNQAGLVGQFGRPVDRQPLIHGEKISFKPTPNLEFSVDETTVFDGGPTPLTWHTFLKSYEGFTVPVANTPGTTDITDPRSGVNFTYRVPWLRKWLTFYGDAFTEDEYSPLGYPRKSAIQGGIYLPRIPGVPKLDLRLEGGTTAPVDFPGCAGCFYVNDRYPDGSYMNAGNLLGSWLGRAGQGEQAWSTYWLSSRDKIQLNYRHQKVSGQYLPQGGTLNDGGVRADFWLGTTVMLSGSVQYEKWNYPVLDPLSRSNVTTSIQLTFWPRSWK